MELVQFGCEDWLNVWEKSATIDIARYLWKKFWPLKKIMAKLLCHR